MADNFVALDRWMGSMIARLRTGQRLRMARRIGIALRRANAARITQNVTPEGEAMEPRKKRTAEQRRADARKGRVRRKGRMFPKIRLARKIRIKTSPDEVVLGFQPQAARTASVHHFGLRDRVARFRGAPEVRYPSRPLFGFGPGDDDEAMAIMMDQLANGG